MIVRNLLMISDTIIATNIMQHRYPYRSPDSGTNILKLMGFDPDFTVAIKIESPNPTI